MNHPIFTKYYYRPDGYIMASRHKEAKQSLHNGKLVLTIKEDKDSSPIKYPVDRFIYEAVVGESLNDFLRIIHLDGDKLNNAVSNLKLTINDNANPTKTFLQIIATNLDTNRKTNYDSISAASKDLEINTGSISLILNGKRKKAKSKRLGQRFSFVYKNDVKPKINYFLTGAKKLIPELESKRKKYLKKLRMK